MIDNFVLNPKEVGFIIVIQDISNNEVKYIGKENTVITENLLELNIESECLDNLVLFDNDEDGICEVINEYRKKGIDARMYSVFRDTGHRILDCDETEEYIKYAFIAEIR